jgi:Glycosyl transferases group 1
MKQLHIISFDIPYPADYGGVMDVFYKIRALHEQGVRIILHCFQYGNRTPQAELEKYCAAVHYYPRSMSPFNLLSTRPFIVVSRQKRALLKNLQADNAPILFEGLHSCAFIGEKILRGRTKLIRMHNVEWEYYRNLDQLESRFWKKIFFKTESKKLERFENEVLKYADALLTISPDDTGYFEEKIEKLGLNATKVQFAPPFHPNESVESRQGTGDYVLFHGKLSVSDNEEAALYLIKKVFSQRDIPLRIAGKEPTERLVSLAQQHDNVDLIANPSEREMNDLIQNAQINVLVSFQRSGMKLKLLNALFRGRHCVVNRHTIQNTGLESLCILRNTSKDIGATVESLMNVQFSAQSIADRKAILEKGFSNRENALKIVQLL